MMRKLVLLLLLTSLIACKPLQPSKGGAPGRSSKGLNSRQTSDNQQNFGTFQPPGNLGNTPSNAPIEGTSSGGGSFADTYAREVLSIVKLSLSKIILNASPELFKKFPKDKGQKWLSDLIKNVELDKTKEPYRHGNPLKFDYDKNTGKIWATNHYVTTFPYGRFWTQAPIEQHRIIMEVMIDMLHEAAHFYDIGTNEKDDKYAENWSLLLLEYLSQDVLACESEQLKDWQDKPVVAGTLIHRPSGQAYSRELYLPKSEEYVESFELELLRGKTSGGERFLVSPKFFIDQIEELKASYIVDDAEPMEVRSEKAVKTLVDISGIDVGTIWDEEFTSKQMFVLFQNPHQTEGYWKRDAEPKPIDGRISLGNPSLEGGNIAYARSVPHSEQTLNQVTGEVLADKPTYLFDKLTIDNETGKAVYIYGIAAKDVKLDPEQVPDAANPLFTKTIQYTCHRVNENVMSMDKNIEGEEKPMVEVRDAGVDLKDFGIGASKVMAANSKEIFGTTPAGKPCRFEFFYTPEVMSESKTLVLRFGEGDPKVYNEADLIGFLQSNYRMAEGKLISRDEENGYELINAEATPEKLIVRQLVYPDHGEMGKAKIVGGQADIEVEISNDPETSIIKSVRVTKYEDVNSVLECSF